ncbi:HAD family hydrolase [Lachnobacterium bovis]|uniref:Putative hydrolase of the HAD superfamily n=1 Tax=Lachnobacterium bovis TaxID=140626 RepID=A0A1H9R3T6_9FIRM|nr:HAD family hydrolase [Lachnobacterium bovis]SER67175.1 putative hydrolase of the HAD superfamily [Lachnobacterium bovis]
MKTIMTAKKNTNIKKFDNYLFDLYGTLIDIRTNEDSDKLWNTIRILYGYEGAIYTNEELKDMYHFFIMEEMNIIRKKNPNRKHIDVDLGKVFKKLFEYKKINKISEDKIKNLATTFRSISTENITLYDGVYELLDFLKENKKKIFLLSNAQSLFTLNELKMFGLDKYFDDIFISSDYEVSKPDEEFFMIPIKKYNLDTNKTVMIGNDYLSDMQGASKVKIHGIYIHQEISTPVDNPDKIIADCKIMSGVFKNIKLFLEE